MKAFSPPTLGCVEEGCNQDAEELVLVNPDNDDDNNRAIPVVLCSKHYKELLNTWYGREKAK